MDLSNDIIQTDFWRNIILYSRAQEVVQESYLSLVKLPDVDTCHKNHELRLTFQNLKEQLVYIAKQAK